jgi:hypothetical protein
VESIVKTLVRSVFVVGLFAAFGAAVPAASAQQIPTEEIAPTARNAFYVELLGNGLLYSLNYDRLFADQISGRVGIMLIGAANDTSAAGVIAAPILANYLFGRGNSHFEAGIGITLMSGAVENVEEIEEEGFSGAVGTATLGYRYQRPGGGFVFRAGLTPFFGGGGILPWFGLSFGYGF